MRHAFALAQSRPRKLMTVVTKSNAQRFGMVMWDEIAREVLQDHPDVTWDKMLVDAMTVPMTLNPSSQIGSEHVGTRVTIAHLESRLQLQNTKVHPEYSAARCRNESTDESERTHT